MPPKINIRKIHPDEVVTVVSLHQKTMPGLSSQLGKDYLHRFYQTIVNHQAIYHCLVALKNKQVVGVIVLTGDAKKSNQLLHSLWSWKTVVNILIGFIKQKIHLGELISRLRFERLMGEELKLPHQRILILMVDDKYQRQGIGQKLLRSIIEQYPKSKEKKLYVDTRADNLTAIKFYQKAGFIIKDKAFKAVIMEYQCRFP